MADYKAPHCDDLVLHAPSTCKYCDTFPDKQQERIDNGINFTGEHKPGKKQCPAEARRSISTINLWYGNVPQPDEAKSTDACPKCGKQGQWINLALVCPDHGVYG